MAGSLEKICIKRGRKSLIFIVLKSTNSEEYAFLLSRLNS